MNLLTLLIGPTRAGKSNLIANLCVDAIEAGECAVIFDFIENCELSDNIARLFPADKVLEIRCDDYRLMQGFGYNEVGTSADPFKAYENAKRQTANVLTLVNSIHTDESRLSPKMGRYLESASLVVFIGGGSIRDVFAVLQNHKARATFLAKVPASQRANLEEYIESLRELDDYDTKGVIIGTRTSQNTCRDITVLTLSNAKMGMHGSLHDCRSRSVNKLKLIRICHVYLTMWKNTELGESL